MSREIVLQQQPTGVKDLDVIAQKIAQSRMFGLDPAQAFTLCLLAESEGLPPIQAVRRFHIINGRPSMRADAMQAEFQRHGGTVEWLVSTAEECKAVFRHPVHAPKGLEIHVTLKELVERGVAKNPTYRTYPRQMLRARVISEGVRAVDPGIVVGIYTPEETSEFEPPPRVVDVTPSREAQALGDGLMEQFDAPKEAPAKRSNPKARHQAPAEVAAEMKGRQQARYHQDVIGELVKGADAEWSSYCDAMGLEFKPVVHPLQVENHLATWALERGIAKPEHIEKEDGKRDPRKVSEFVASLNRKNPERFAGMVAEYLAGKVAELKKQAEEALGPPAAEDENQDPATPPWEEVHGDTVIERPGKAAAASI